MLELLLILAIVYLFAIRCRSGHPGLKDLQGWSYAHRGLHSEGIPENSMAAFKAALDHGYGIELDVHLLKDGNLAVIHDSLLNRTTGLPGRIEDLTTEQLKDYRLEGTDETIPEFMDVLTLYNGKAPLIVELKPVDGNHAQLADTACKMLESYEGVYCLESFDPRCVKWLKENRPNLIRGQLSEYFLENDDKLHPLVRFMMSHNLLNCMGRPDFVAYKFQNRERTVTNQIWKDLMGVQGVSWTLKTPEEYKIAVKEGYIPIFEGFLPE
jgi:glycerophosphoryl diester phosphodiesterase